MTLSNVISDVYTYSPYNHKEALDWHLLKSKMRFGKLSYGLEYVVSISPVVVNSLFSHVLVCSDFTEDQWLRPLQVCENIELCGRGKAKELARKQMGVNWFSGLEEKLVDVELLSWGDKHNDGRLNFNLRYTLETSFSQKVEAGCAMFAPVWVRVSEVALCAGDAGLLRIGKKLGQRMERLANLKQVQGYGTFG